MKRLFILSSFHLLICVGCLHSKNVDINTTSCNFSVNYVPLSVKYFIPLSIQELRNRGDFVLIKNSKILCSFFEDLNGNRYEKFKEEYWERTDLRVELVKENVNDHFYVNSQKQVLFKGYRYDVEPDRVSLILSEIKLFNINSKRI